MKPLPSSPKALNLKAHVPVTDFQVVTLADSGGAEVALLYALGSDGIIWAWQDGDWIPLPVYAAKT